MYALSIFTLEMFQVCQILKQKLYECTALRRFGSIEAQLFEGLDDFGGIIRTRDSVQCFKIFLLATFLICKISHRRIGPIEIFLSNLKLQ